MNGLRDKMNALKNPAQSPQIEALASAIAEVERDQHAAVQQLYEALDADPPADLMPAEDRVDQFQRLVSYQMDGDLWGYFVKEQAPHGLQNTGAAWKHAGKSPEEWSETVEEWAGNIREQIDGGEAFEDRTLAARFCQKRFGVDLDVFEAAVVDWSAKRTLRMAARGPLDANIKRIESAADAIETAEDVEPEPEEVEGE